MSLLRMSSEFVFTSSSCPEVWRGLSYVCRRSSLWRSATRRICTWMRPTASGPWGLMAEEWWTTSAWIPKTLTSWWEHSPRALALLEDTLEAKRCVNSHTDQTARFRQWNLKPWGKGKWWREIMTQADYRSLPSQTSSWGNSNFPKQHNECNSLLVLSTLFNRNWKFILSFHFTVKVKLQTSLLQFSCIRTKIQIQRKGGWIYTSSRSNQKWLTGTPDFTFLGSCLS